MKCGNCQAVCQVYAHLKDETTTARAKIAIAEFLFPNKIKPGFTPSSRLRKILNNCLNCYSCMAECPSKVEVEEIFIKTKEKINRNFLPERLRLQLMSRMAKTKLPNIFSLSRWAKKHPPLKNAKKKIGFYYGCMVDLAMINLGKATVKLLENNNFGVVLAPEQKCCGIPLIYSGGYELTKELAVANAKLFKDVDTIVTVCPTCGHALKNLYKKLLPKALADEFCPKVQDITEFLYKEWGHSSTECLNISRRVSPSLRHLKVTYHDPCHLSKSQGIKDAPRKILKAIPGIDFVEMKDASTCCGFGGTFSLTHKKLAKEIGLEKIKNIEATYADLVISACPGCQLHINSLLKQKRLKQKTLHLVELLA